MTPDMAVVTPLNNPGGPEGDTVTVDDQLLNTEYCPENTQHQSKPPPPPAAHASQRRRRPRDHLSSVTRTPSSFQVAT
jgi:hypothetical protein